MSWGAVIAAGATLVGGAMASEGSRKAAKTAAASSDAAIAEQRRQFDTIQMNNAPYRNIGVQALNALGSIYGYAPTNQVSTAMAGAAPATFAPMQTEIPGGKWNVGGQLLKGSGFLSKIHDPFASRHGDENRNLKAFSEEAGVMQLPDGRLVLPDGSTFSESQLKDVAGTWYGAVHAPDGNQEDWQRRWDDLRSRLTKIEMPSQATAGATPAAPTNALTAPDYSNFYKSPDYTFRRDEGLKSIERTAAARGGAFSGNALKALTEFNSNLAAGEFGNYFNRQAAFAGIGQTATTQTNQAGLITGQGVSNALQNHGDARASGVAGSYNAWGDALSGLAQGAGYYFGNRDPRRDPSGIGYFTPTVRRV